MPSIFQQYLHQRVKIIIDRPMNSKHPNGYLFYPVNYGYVPGTKAPDGEEIDAYVLDIDKPIKEFEGVVIAIIHRLNDNDDKLVVVPEGENLTNEDIKSQTYFQEKYFESEIIR